MKLLCWMRPKPRQSSAKPCKGFTTGNRCICLLGQSSFDDQDEPPKPYSGSGYYKQCNQLCEKPFSGIVPGGIQGQLYDETSNANSELFHGFLTIGTPGSEPVISEPATPTFGMSPEDTAEGKKEVMENDLKLISDEEEKFLEAETEEVSNESSGRSSLASTITLGGKPLEAADTEENLKSVVCPLQGYVFCSSIELPETTVEVKKEKGSLAELFQRTESRDENFVKKHWNMKEAEKRSNLKHKHVKSLNKKLLKKIHASSRSSNPAKGDSVPTKKKLQKMVQTLYRKIHLEKSTAAGEENKSSRLQTNNTLSNGSYINGDSIRPDNNNSGRRVPLGLNQPEGALGYETNTNSPQHELAGTSSGQKREYWINADAEYFVLELQPNELKKKC